MTDFVLTHIHPPISLKTIYHHNLIPFHYIMYTSGIKYICFSNVKMLVLHGELLLPFLINLLKN